MADVLVSFPGASAHEVESLIATPGEQVLDEIEGLEHIYSTSSHGMAVLTLQFEVGVPRRDALVRLHNQISCQPGLVSGRSWSFTAGGACAGHRRCADHGADLV